MVRPPGHCFPDHPTHRTSGPGPHDSSLLCEWWVADDRRGGAAAGPLAATHDDGEPRGVGC